MTDDELRQAVKNILMTIPTGDSGNYFHDDLVQVFAQAFKQQQAVAWKEAAEVWRYALDHGEAKMYCKAKAKELAP